MTIFIQPTFSWSSSFVFYSLLLEFGLCIVLACLLVSSVEEDDDEDEDEAAEVRGTSAGSCVEQQQLAAEPSANQPVPAGFQLPAPPLQKPTEAPPNTAAQTKSPALSSSSQAPPTLLPQV